MFNWFFRPNRPIGPLWIQQWCICCCQFSGWLDIALTVLDCLGEHFCTDWNCLNTPEMRVVSHCDCRILFHHIEKAVVPKSWAKFNQRLARHWNFSGRKPSCSCKPQNCRLNIPSHTLHINPGTYQESPFAPLVGLCLVHLVSQALLA